MKYRIREHPQGTFWVEENIKLPDSCADDWFNIAGFQTTYDNFDDAVNKLAEYKEEKKRMSYHKIVHEE